MSLFPRCSFALRVPGDRVVTGTRADATLVVSAPAPIARAERIFCRFESELWAWVSPGGGTLGSSVRDRLFETSLEIPLPRGLLAGTHTFAFPLELPQWLPPALRGTKCGVEHKVSARLDVGWALDPSAVLRPRIALPPRASARSPFVGRSPRSFHDRIVLDLTLASTVITQDECLEGTIALRGGAREGFDGIELALMSRCTFKMRDHDVDGEKVITSLSIPAALLREGDPVPFYLAASDLLEPSFKNRSVHHQLFLVVSAYLRWATNPSYEIALEVLPSGSILEGSSPSRVAGTSALRQLAADIAAQTGLREAAPPVLVEGSEGAVHLQLIDMSRAGELAVQAVLRFPDLALGISFGPRGAAGRPRRCVLLPALLAERFAVSFAPEGDRADISEAALAALLRAMLGDLEAAVDVALSDRRLAVDLRIGRDPAGELVSVARAARERARGITRAIAELPFAGPAEARTAWERTASDQRAIFVPTGPSLYGVELRARTVTGEERAIGITIRTAWDGGEPITEVEVDLHSAPLPAEACALLEFEAAKAVPEALRVARQVFPAMRASGDGRSAVLSGAEWTADPSTILPAVDAFFDFVLDARDERRAQSAYR